MIHLCKIPADSRKNGNFVVCPDKNKPVMTLTALYIRACAYGIFLFLYRLDMQTGGTVSSSCHRQFFCLG